MEILTDDISIKSGILTGLSGHNIFEFCLKENYSIAIWRQPGKDLVNYIIQLSGKLPKTVTPDLENMEPGFLTSPYNNESNQLNYLIKADIHLTSESSDSLRLKILNYTSFDESCKSFILKAKSNKSETEKESGQNSGKQYISSDSDHDKFRSLVTLSVDKIREGRFQKVVPSRITELAVPASTNIYKKFQALCDIHPLAFVSLFSIPDKGSWLGASPEILIKIDNKKTFYTSAVAGTQTSANIDNLTSVAWTQKEIEEQALVSRYIINCFKKIRLREFEESGPKTVKAGNLVHLRTDFKVDMKAVNFPQLGSVMLKLLHPTSAVCGMPKEPAEMFLKENENFDREFFSGYIGPVNIENCTSLYVNLRCAKIFNQKAFLYAGAGVTFDSIPEKEWNETEMKLRSIMQVFDH